MTDAVETAASSGELGVPILVGVSVSIIQRPWRVEAYYVSVMECDAFPADPHPATQIMNTFHGWLALVLVGS